MKLYVVVHDDGDGILWARGAYDTEQEAEKLLGKTDPCPDPKHEHFWDGDDGTPEPRDAMTCIDAEPHDTVGCCQVLETRYQ